ncbi:cholesterol oxidase [Minicystis rosea]|nr:cholesterol oxidase [Minicystis rosea]
MMTAAEKRRSLILAGGGLKVAFQAGVLEVWLDEAGLTFDHVDAASGGVFNLAMLCQGMSGRQIADNWRNIDPLAGIDFNWGEMTKLAHGASIATLERYRKNIFPAWGLDWDRIRASRVPATFNVYDFTRHELSTIGPDRMTEDLLIAAVSLPMWFPPVRIDGDLYIDAVFVTDANLEEALRRGADELWIIWTVRDQGEWHDGFVAEYFQIVEAAANGNFKRVTRRIAESNAAIATGGRGELGRPVALEILKEDVPLHYLIAVGKDRIVEAVEAGVEEARRWCGERGIPLGKRSVPRWEARRMEPTKVSFTEEMKGFMSPGDGDYDVAFREGRQDRRALMFHLTITVDDVDRFVTHPDHEARAEGTVRSEAFGGAMPVERGVFNLFVEHGTTDRKEMLYRLYFRDAAGQPLTLSGFKDIKNDPGFDVWSDTTTLFTRILRGHVPKEAEPDAEVVATGILHIFLLDFAKQLGTFRTEGPSVAARADGLRRFAQLFLGKLWDVYARDVVTQSPA